MLKRQFVTQLVWRSHGFRSSFRDWAAEKTDHPREVVEAALAHAVRNPVEAAYARSDLFALGRLSRPRTGTGDQRLTGDRPGRLSATGCCPPRRTASRFDGAGSEPPQRGVSRTGVEGRSPSPAPLCSDRTVRLFVAARFLLVALPDLLVVRQPCSVLPA